MAISAWSRLPWNASVILCSFALLFHGVIGAVILAIVYAVTRKTEKIVLNKLLIRCEGQWFFADPSGEGVLDVAAAS